MRQQLDIYASLVLCKSVPGFPTRHADVDFAIIRENTEGEYSGLEHQVSIAFLLKTATTTDDVRSTVFPWCCRVAEDHDSIQIGTNRSIRIRLCY